MGASMFAAAAAALVAPAQAQQQPAPPVATEEEEDEIVITGSIIRGNTNSVSPLTVLGEEELEARGISTIQDAIQKLGANGGPALTNSFSANGAGRAALAARRGGVGYYAGSNFVHVDTGRVRTW